MILATLHDAVAGVAALKLHEMEDVFPDREHWLGGVVVRREYRGRGIGSALVREVERVAAGRGVELLHLQTEDLDGGLYARLGWEPRERLTYRSYEALVMTRRLQPAASP